MSIDSFKTEENVDASQKKEANQIWMNLEEYTRKKAELTAKIVENEAKDGSWENPEAVLKELENLGEFDKNNFEKKSVPQEIKDKFLNVEAIKNVLGKEFVEDFMNRPYQSGDWHVWNKDFLNKYLEMNDVTQDAEMWIIQHFQELVGTYADGKFGPDTRAAFVNLIQPDYFKEKFASNPKFAAFFEENEVKLNDLAELSGGDFWEMRNALWMGAIRKMIEGKKEQINYNNYISDAAVNYGLSVRDLNALIQVESGGDVYAMSPTGPMGIMQLSRWIYGPNEYGGPINPFNPKEAINRGAAHLADLINKYDGNKRLAFTAYNQGETAVNRALKSGGISSLSTEGRRYANLIKRAGGVDIV